METRTDDSNLGRLHHSIRRAKELVRERREKEARYVACLHEIEDLKKELERHPNNVRERNTSDAIHLFDAMDIDLDFKEIDRRFERVRARYRTHNARMRPRPLHDDGRLLYTSDPDFETTLADAMAFFDRQQAVMHTHGLTSPFLYKIVDAFGRRRFEPIFRYTEKWEQRGLEFLEVNEE